ncbi:MAG TPA: hypothetical protein VHB45_13010 [Alloacidobacterium sp.]|nr:hypothetical protein [Alloacidobacterium sp.]
MDEYGELYFPGAQASGPVIHRTPEELGIPRVVQEAEVKPSWYAREALPPRVQSAAEAGQGIASRESDSR